MKVRIRHRYRPGPQLLVDHAGDGLALVVLSMADYGVWSSLQKQRGRLSPWSQGHTSLLLARRDSYYL